VKKTSAHTTKTIASTLADLLGVAEALAQAHDALELPAHDDETCDWAATLAAVDAMGSATHQLAQVATEHLLPVLRTLRDQATTARREIECLKASLAEAHFRA
jgi:hypothetical protein